MLDLNFKVVSTKKLDKYDNLIGTIFSINNIVICETRLGSDYFCKIDKSGTPSNIRSVSKKTKETSWNLSNINVLVGEFPNRSDFVNYYPDTTYGSTGKAISKKEVVNLMKAFIIKHS